MCLPSVARSMSGHRSTGMPFFRQLLTLGTATPASRATAAVPPSSSIAVSIDTHVSTSLTLTQAERSQSGVSVGLMDIADVHNLRREQLKKLLTMKPYDGSVKKLASRLDIHPSQVSQWTSGHRGISDKSREHIERCCELPPGWLNGEFDQRPLRVEQQPARFSDAMEWPFSVSRRSVAALPPEKLSQANAYLQGLVDGYQGNDEKGASFATG